MTPRTVVLPTPPTWDWYHLLAHWMPGDQFQPDPEGNVERYYRTKAQIAAWLNPATILEIGVRAGYSAIAFGMGAPRLASYIGLDADANAWGGMPGCLAHARAVLPRALELVEVSVVAPCDTQRLTRLIGALRHADLAHVDGDHSWAGARHDIELCLDAGARFVVVDDTDFVPAVSLAAMQVHLARSLEVVHVGDGGYRGNLIIANAGETFPDA